MTHIAIIAVAFLLKLPDSIAFILHLLASIYHCCTICQYFYRIQVVLGDHVHKLKFLSITKEVLAVVVGREVWTKRRQCCGAKEQVPVHLQVDWEASPLFF